MLSSIRIDHITSRSGEPKWDAVTSSSTPPPWSTSVHWAKADILNPPSYHALLVSASAVVHSMGILFEADYKGVLTGQVNPISGLQRAFSSSKLGTQNPLAADKNAQLTPQESDGQLTYEIMNRDSAVGLARAASEAGVKTFGYISAAAGAPVLPERYIKTKREAEEQIASKFIDMRPLFIRPGMLYDSSRKITVGLAGATAMGAMANSLTGGRLTALMGAGGTKPLKADVVAEAVVEAVDDESQKGVIEVSKIETLANTAWRKGML